jgi:acetyl esterase
MKRPTPNAEAQAYLDSLPQEPDSLGDLAAARRQMRERSLADSGPPEPVAEVEDIDAGGVPARLYQPVGGERDVLVWLHGGGWVLGDLDCHDAVSRALANRAGCAVLSVEYRLAPEYPFPAALEDCWAATTWATRRFRQLAIGGESAGGNLAAAVALRARDRSLRLALQLLVCPVLDYRRVDGAAYREWGQRYRGFAGRETFGVEFTEGMRWIWEQYVPDVAQRATPEASPLQAPSLAGVAPALIITAEHDLLHEEDLAYARRLEQEGVPVTLRTFEGQIHGFFQLLGAMNDARQAVHEAAAAVRAALGAARPLAVEPASEFAAARPSDHELRI